MRRIPRRPPDSKTWKRWIADCLKATKKLAQQVARGEKPTIGALYKRKSIKDAYFLSAGPPFYGKCAYCEAPIHDYQHGDVEHFRPKAAVTDEHDRPIFLRNEQAEILVDADGKPIPHPGYYWLAYEWTNLLPSCVKCNQAGVREGRKIGKHKRFPVEAGSRHAQRPEEEAEEKPLLINPLSDLDADELSLHLAVDTKTGVMAFRTQRGKACCEIFGLNLRNQLIDDRKRACNEVELLWLQLWEPSRQSEVLEELKAIRRGEKPFTAAQVARLRELAADSGIIDL